MRAGGRWLWVLCCVPAWAGCASDPDVRFIAFGDSTTAGPSTRDYIEYLADDLGWEPGTWANEGNGGETTTEGVTRLATLLAADHYPNAEILLYWEGGNDLIDSISAVDPLLLSSPLSADFPHQERLDEVLDGMQAGIEEAVRLARSSGLQVFVANYFFLPEPSFNCDPLPLGILFSFQAQRANGYVTRLNERIAAAAANTGATLIDIAALDGELRGTPDNYENCNHLSAAGNALAAERFAEVLRAAGL